MPSIRPSTGTILDTSSRSGGIQVTGKERVDVEFDGLAWAILLFLVNRSGGRSKGM